MPNEREQELAPQSGLSLGGAARTVAKTWAQKIPIKFCRGGSRQLAPPAPHALPN